VNEAEAAGGARTLYLWAMCVKRGIAAFEFGVSGTLEALAFTGANGVLNVGTPSELLCVVPNCPTDGAVLLGSWIVNDVGGTFCARPSTANDWIVAVDCEIQRGYEPRITGFSSDGSAPCVVGEDGCWTPTAPNTPSGVAKDLDEAAAVGIGPLAARIAPNPFSGRVQIQLSGFEPSGVRATIYDVTGRLVRRIDAIAAATPAMQWDGRDDAGRLSRAGVYFLRIESGEASSTRKIVYLGP
jgi:hypothetical protein